MKGISKSSLIIDLDKCGQALREQHKINAELIKAQKQSSKLLEAVLKEYICIKELRDVYRIKWKTINKIK